ncbi:MAG TPA: hypothetical protein VNI55_14580, partial [Gaiellaceae bacterium]|nr:hypothetical protein [Gaiellaceae bacterium]
MTPDREAAIRALAECTVQRLGSFNPHTLDAETLNGLEHAKSVLTLSDALDEARRELAESRQEPEAGIAAHMATMAQCDDLAAERDSLTAELAVKDEAL